MRQRKGPLQRRLERPFFVCATFRDPTDVLAGQSADQNSITVTVVVAVPAMIPPFVMAPFTVTPFAFAPALVAITTITAVSIAHDNRRWRRNVHRCRRVVTRYADPHGDIDVSGRRR